jgi:hypothetical protein
VSARGACTGGERTHAVVPDSLVARSAHERDHAEAVGDELVGEDGGVRLDLYEVNRWNMRVSLCSAQPRLRRCLTDGGDVRYHHAPDRVRQPSVVQHGARARRVQRAHAMSTSSSTKSTLSFCSLRIRTSGALSRVVCMVASTVD